MDNNGVPITLPGGNIRWSIVRTHHIQKGSWMFVPSTDCPYPYDAYINFKGVTADQMAEVTWSLYKNVNEEVFKNKPLALLPPNKLVNVYLDEPINKHYGFYFNPGDNTVYVTTDKNGGYYIEDNDKDNDPLDGWNDWQRKNDLTTVYMQAYQSGNLLGIQYWFYYPYHDCPTGDAHQHDWWYFWVVYDISDHTPSQLVYDFHHNLQVCRFTDKTHVNRVGFHSVVYTDAGGHRCLWDVGEDITLAVASGVLWDKNLAYSLRNDKRDGDKRFGVMIKKQANDKELASWRGTDKGLLGGGWCGEWTFTPTGGTILQTEYFTHWVWVAGVETGKTDNSGQTCSKVDYTETGTPFYTGDEANLWPESGTYLPWMQSYSWIDDAHTNMRSSPIMVWYWQQYTMYNSANPQQHPDIFTKYYDGSS